MKLTRDSAVGFEQMTTVPSGTDGPAGFGSTNQAGQINQFSFTGAPGVRILSGSQRAIQCNRLRLEGDGEHRAITHSRAALLKEGQVRGSPKWCLVFSWTENKAGCSKPTRHGSKSHTQCLLCKVFVYRVIRKTRNGNLAKKTCWDRWHSSRRPKLHYR